MVKRKVLWYKSSEANPERHNYNFLVINSNREINQIKQKLYERLQPITEETMIENGVVDELKFELFTLQSSVNTEDFSRVYRGELKKDRRLQPRKTSGGWNTFLEQIASGGI